MPNDLTIQTLGVESIGDTQIKLFAVSIVGNVKQFIYEHNEEYQAWLKESQHYKEELHV